MEYLDKGAIISDCKQFRYRLWRVWNHRSPGVAFIGLNPSTADANKDDATIRKCVEFANRWGFGRINMLNLFAFRATEPKDMKRAIDPVGPKNEEYLECLCRSEDRVIAAWGRDGSFNRQDRIIMKLVGDCGMKCFKINKDGSPKHPLYVSYKTELIPYK